VPRVSVLYFAALRDLAGRDSESLDLPQPQVSVSELLALLEHNHPALHSRLEGVRVAVNEEFVSAAHAVEEGDVVALIPPVSGG